MIMEHFLSPRFSETKKRLNLVADFVSQKETWDCKEIRVYICP